MNILIKRSLMSVALSALIMSTSGCGGGGGDSAPSTTSTSTAVVAVGMASVSGSTASAITGISPSSAFKASSALEVDSTTSSVLIIDSNSNGEFGDSSDKVISAEVSAEGAFDFGAVAVNKTGETKAQLTVSKQGFAPVSKIITLVDGQSVSIETDAASTPLLTEVVDISSYRASGTLSSSFLKIGIKKTSDGFKSYSAIMSLSEMKANADVPISGDVETETTIPLGALPDSVTSVTAETQSFDPTNEEDAKKFPGDYVGVGEPGQGEQRLVSVGFDYMSLTDQNGDSIDLDLDKLSASSKLLPQAVDYTSCLRESTRRLSGAQLDLFKKYGDDDNDTSEFEIPLWYYNGSAGNWQYLGQAEVYEDRSLTTDYNVTSTATSAYARMCITENWGTSVNLDYSFAPQEPVNVCVVAKDQEGGAVSNLYVSAKKDTARDGHYLDSDGKTKIALLAGNDVTDYEFTYSGALTGWNSTTVQTADIVDGGESGCDNTVNITVVNPYSATLKVTVKELDGSIAANKYVYVYNGAWGEDYYYQSEYTDENGVATFKVKPSTNYGVYYNNKVVDANVNGTVISPEEADNGRIATVTVQEEEQAPEVSVYMYNNSISDTSESVNFYVSASDGNGDAISLKSLTLNGSALVKGTDYTVTETSSYTGYEYLYAKLNLSSVTLSAITPSSLSAGVYSLEATYSDAKAEGKDSQRFTVNENRAPQISSVYLQDSVTQNWIYINSEVKAGTYDISAYAYDLDADEVTLTYALDDTNLTSATGIVLIDGDHTLVITATDGTLSTSKTFTFFVGNNAPEITSFGATSYSVDLASSNTKIKLYAYAQDKEYDALTVKTTDGTIILEPSYTGSRYFTSSDIVIDANRTFTIVANDGDKNSTAKSLTVTTYSANQAPVFEKELTGLQVPNGSSQTLECVAVDPEGDAVTYKWFIGDIEQSGETSTTFTHTFTANAAVSCLATDADALEPASATSSATITVYDASAVGTLTVNTLPGAIVATHNSTTLVPLEEKLADSNGVVTFSVAGTDRVTFSVSVGPDVAVSAETLFEATLSDIYYNLDYTCDTTYYETVPDVCSSFNKDTFRASTSIPNAIGNYLLGAGVGDTVDTSGNGSVDSAENFAYVLSENDTDSNGVLTWGEHRGSSEVNSEFFVNVPVREYTINLYQYQNGVHDQFYEGEEWSYLPSTINFSDFIENMQIAINGWMSAYITSDGNATINTEFGSSDGKYSYQMAYTDENNDTKYLLGLDKTAAEVESMSFTPADFTLNGTDVTVTTVEDEYLNVSMNYGHSYLGSFGASSSVLNDVRISYDINTNLNAYDSVTGSFSNKYTSGYYGDGTLQTSYDSADYPHLDVTASFDGVDTISLAGLDLSKVNYTNMNFSSYARINTTSDLNVSSRVSVKFNYTITPSSVTKLNLENILPSAIANTIMEGSIEDGSLYISMNEYKNTSEVEFLDAINGTTSEYSLYSNGYRSLYYSLSASSVTAMSTLNKDLKPRYAKPFSIGYEAK